MIRDAACIDAARRIVTSMDKDASEELVQIAASIIKMVAFKDEMRQLEEIDVDAAPAKLTVIEGGKPA